MFSEKVGVGGQQGVYISDVLHDIIYCPQVGVLTTGLCAFLETAYEHTPQAILISSIYYRQHISSSSQKFKKASNSLCSC